MEKALETLNSESRKGKGRVTEKRKSTSRAVGRESHGRPWGIKENTER